MNIVNLGENDSILNKYVSQLRDVEVQKDSMRFRNNLQRLGSIFAYEISKTLEYSPKQVQTPNAAATVRTPDSRVVLSTVLRAGLPLHEGLLSCFDDAQNAFIAAFRKYDGNHEMVIDSHYCATPELSGKVLIIADTMLATGSSILVAYNNLLAEGGQPVHTHFVCPIASRYAVDKLRESLPENTTLWTATVDPTLDSRSYIVPGLGDAGDLCFGEKL